MKIKIIKTEPNFAWKLGDVHEVIREVTAGHYPHFDEDGYYVDTNEGKFYIRKSWCKVANKWKERLEC